MAHSRLKRIIGCGFVFALALAAAFTVFAARPQDAPLSPAAQAWVEEPDSCTSIQVGRLATVDGSVITCHTCDGPYRQWVNIVPHQKWPDKSMAKIYSGKMHTETSTDLRGIVQTGEIPQVAETYRFLNTAYPSLNEAGLAIGETTFGGRRELVNNEGMFMIEELERLALERCKTAREAIKLIGELVKQYGYGDDGECITIADGKEVWHFEIMGAGPLEKGAVWAAVRIPDDHVGISANICRISEVDLKNPDRYMASENVFQLAQDMGWWDAAERQAVQVLGGLRRRAGQAFLDAGVLRPQHARAVAQAEHGHAGAAVLGQAREEAFGPGYSGHLPQPVRGDGPRYDQEHAALPPAAAPQAGRGSGRPALDAPDGPEQHRQRLDAPGCHVHRQQPQAGDVQMQRTIPIAGCAYATVLQIKGWLPPAVGAVCWFSFDNPAMSARIPIFAGATELPPSFEICAQHNFRLDSAAWAFRRANRLATLKWGMTKKIVQDTIAEFEDKAFADMPQIEKRVQEILASKTPDKEPFTVERYLTKYTNDAARAAIQKYLELGDRFWMLIAMGL